MSIRPATAADLPQLVELFRQHAAHQHRLSSCFPVRPDADLAGFLATRMTSPAARIFVAAGGDALIGYILVRIVQQQDAPTTRSWSNRLRRLVGFHSDPAPVAAVFPRRRHGFVEDWYVVPHRRQEGVGTALWNISRDWFRDHHVREVEATILTANELARRRFDQLGFEPVRILVRKQLDEGEWMRPQPSRD